MTALHGATGRAYDVVFDRRRCTSDSLLGRRVPDLFAAIRLQVTRDKANLVEFAAELIRIPSENPPGRRVLETRHYAALRILALACGPGLLSVSHGPHEFVAIDKLLECAEVYALTAMRLLS